MLARMFCAALALLLGSAYATAADLSIAVGADVTSIDPHYHNLTPNNNIAEHIFETLITKDPKSLLKPALAVSWKAIDDLTWEFRLRKGVKFHDGSDFTAADVVFSIERTAQVPNSPSPFTLYTNQITEKIIVDPLTVRLKTATPYPLMPNDMGTVFIVSSRVAKGATTADFDSGKATVGTGPFKFVRYAKGDRVELARFDGYWGAKSAWDKVTFRVIASDPSRVASLLAGDVRAIESVPTADLARLAKDPSIAISRTVSHRLIFLHLDTNRDKSPMVTDKSGKPLDKNPLKDVRVRKAISKAINRQAIVERVMEGAAVATGQLMPEGMFGYVPGMKPEAFDADGARKLLAEAGYPDGFEVTMDCPNDRYVNDAAICQAVVGMLARIGVKVTLLAQPKALYFAKILKPGGYQSSFYLLGWTPGTSDSHNVLYDIMGCRDDPKSARGEANVAGYCNKKVDELTDKVLVEPDTAKRDLLIKEAFEIAAKEYGYIPLHQQALAWGVSKKVKVVQRADNAVLPYWMVKQAD